jgi:hypothetical protein
MIFPDGIDSRAAQTANARAEARRARVRDGSSGAESVKKKVPNGLLDQYVEWIG